ncbi:hypothetical protein JB92DRAFT_3026549 [Gautieria morchelliformis]|nr:hypothetical protein JB92DRAFT_3026549 [Gautieria morchelliformis]
MLGIALSLLFISAAACSSSKYTIRGLARRTYVSAFNSVNASNYPSGPLQTIPLSAPLPDGSMILQVNCPVTMEVQLNIGANTCEVTTAMFTSPWLLLKHRNPR